MFSECFASTPPSSLLGTNRETLRNASRTGRNETAAYPVGETKRKREAGGTGPRMKVTYIYIEREKEKEFRSQKRVVPRTALVNRGQSVGVNGSRSSSSAEIHSRVPADTPILKMRSLVLFMVYAHLAFAMVARHHRDGGFLNHVQLVHEFRCSTPQPRAVPVEELLTVGPSPDEVFYPASTVLTRCNGAGCCPDPKQICAPIETRNVSLVFTVKHTIDRQRDRHHEVLHALEHTKCGCVDKKLIKFD